MSLGRDDIRAAVAAGMISEAQAASLLALGHSRRGARENLDGRDEPFELFRGFNEIFIVVGLSILYSGWLGVTGLSAMSSVIAGAGIATAEVAVYAVLSLAGIAALAAYFTLRRRMVAPSIALALMFALSATQLSASLGWGMGLNYQDRIAFVLGFTTLALLGYYAVFRVPFVTSMIALGVFLTVGSLFVIQGAAIPELDELFLLSGKGPFAWLTVVLGLIGFAVAMRFDMSDPHRVTRRSASGFWLHLVAAPAIVNTVALTLLAAESTGAHLALLGILLILALLAIAIDRRSFLVAGAGYTVTIAFITLEGGAMLVILLLGLGLVILGARWEALRRRLMTTLPDFPGKDRLPPWDLIQPEPT